MQRRIAQHVIFLSVLSQFIASSLGQYVGGIDNAMASGISRTGHGLGMSRASAMSMGSVYGVEPDLAYGSGLGVMNFPAPDMGSGYGGRQGPYYGFNGGLQPGDYAGAVQPGLGYPGDMMSGLGYPGGTGPVVGYGSGMGMTGISGVMVPGPDYTGQLGMNGPGQGPVLAYGSGSAIANAGSPGIAGLGNGITSYPAGVPQPAPVYPFMQPGPAVPPPQKQAVRSSNANTNTNINVNSNVGKHRTSLLDRALGRIPRY